MPHILTVGHSNHPLEKLLTLLEAHGVEGVLDIRRYPSSRRWPRFGASALAASLRTAGVDYAGLPELGGHRRPLPDSPHTAWREDAFRGYADFMDTAEFAAGLARVEGLAREKRSALLCAEAVPWRCHRSLVADALLVRGWTVEDLLPEGPPRRHELPNFARRAGTRVIYDVGDLPLG